MENHFAKNLKYLRTQYKMTQEDLAKRIEKDYSTIGKWELGLRTPIMADIIKIADIFNISIRDLVEVDLTTKNNKKSPSELEISLAKAMPHLSEDDKETIKFIINKTIENYEKNKNK